MKESVLQKKSRAFALKIIKLTEKLQQNNHYVISNQILRSGTSIGANVSESTYASSTADFINKLSIAQKEANETKYWLELLFGSEYISEEEYEELLQEDMQIIRMIGKSITTLKNNQ